MFSHLDMNANGYIEQEDIPEELQTTMLEHFNTMLEYCDWNADGSIDTCEL